MRLNKMPGGLGFGVEGDLSLLRSCVCVCLDFLTETDIACV